MSELLDLERMRADVAALLHEEPSAIGDDDNLIDLGLDSMRAMNLVARWSAMTGVAFQFAELAEHVTLGGWWAVVQRRQRGGGP